MDLSRLREPFDAQHIEWRLAQAGATKDGRIWAQVLAYITSRAVMDRLDEVCGPENWRNAYAAGPTGGILCGLSIKVGDEWVTKWDGAENTDIEGVKGGLSGAMKRAAVQWGIGRYLYDLPDGWAQVHDKGKHKGSYPKDKRNPKSERVYFQWDPPHLPAWAVPRQGVNTATGELPPEPEEAPAKMDHDAVVTTVDALLRQITDAKMKSLDAKTQKGVIGLQKAHAKGDIPTMERGLEWLKGVVQLLEAGTALGEEYEGEQGDLIGAENAA